MRRGVPPAAKGVVRQTRQRPSLKGFVSSPESCQTTGWLEVSATSASPGCAGIFSWARLGLLCAVVTADGDFTASDFDLDSTIFDFPVAHGAFLRLHGISP